MIDLLNALVQTQDDNWDWSGDSLGGDMKLVIAGMPVRFKGDLPDGRCLFVLKGKTDAS